MKLYSWHWVTIILNCFANCITNIIYFSYLYNQGMRNSEGMKEMFYLTTHSTHFILRLYGVGHMVKDHSDSERGNPLPQHGLLFQINSKGSFMCTIHPTDRIAHTTVFITPVVEHWLEREIAQWVHAMKNRSDDPSHHERTLLPRSYRRVFFLPSRLSSSLFVSSQQVFSLF